MSLDFQKRFLDAVTNGLDDQELFKMMKPVARLSSQKALAVYRDDYKARMLEALGSNYETCWLYLGDEDFFKLGGDYIKANPSALKNLTYYGANFSEFLQSHHQEAASHIAFFEQKFWYLFNAPDTLKHDYTQEEILSGQILFNFDSAYLFDTPIKVYELWKHREGSAEELEGIEFEVPEQLLMYKMGQKVVVIDLSNDQYCFLKILFEEKSIPASVEKYCQQDLAELTPEQWKTIFSLIYHSEKLRSI
jgi:hypothetical protein